jgi:hypothetical protein
MQEFDQAQLAQFTGTEHYYRIGPKHLLTDGTQYLAEKAACYWIMDAIMSHLWEIGTQDWFVVVKIEIADHQAVMIYEDGNGHEHARQCIPYTDFPLSTLTLYACWDGTNWIIMLPSEY